jgi:3'-phosphoadenosine 5'-phosphosulfate sulfotransferase (PAPS reductase)/FAD synthetase
MEKKELTMLSYGGGQDSTAILFKCLHDPVFKAKYVKGDLIVVMANTRNEHDHTDKYLERVEELCDEHKIPFFHLEPDLWASNSWKGGLIKFYQSKNTVGSKAFPKTCTDNLKIRPIYKFLELYVHHNYNTEKYGRKAAFYEFAEKYGKINVLIGIAKGEEKRASENGSSGMKWFNTCINKQYPLIEEGMDRQACQDYITSVGEKVPYPSNCILCPFMSLQELLYLYRYDRASYDLWVKLEANKMKANEHMEEKNLGVWGKKDPLPEVLKTALEKFGHMTEQELVDYKMSHGHCVMSKY